MNKLLFVFAVAGLLAALGCNKGDVPAGSGTKGPAPDYLGRHRQAAGFDSLQCGPERFGGGFSCR